MKEGFYMPKSIHLTGQGGTSKTIDRKRLNHLRNHLIKYRNRTKSAK